MHESFNVVLKNLYNPPIKFTVALFLGEKKEREVKQ